MDRDLIPEQQIVKDEKRTFRQQRSTCEANVSIFYVGCHCVVIVDTNDEDRQEVDDNTKMSNY